MFYKLHLLETYIKSYEIEIILISSDGIINSKLLFCILWIFLQLCTILKDMLVRYLCL